MADTTCLFTGDKRTAGTTKRVKYDAVAHAGIHNRIACVKHAASVHPEPGSNSRQKYIQPAVTPIKQSSLFWNQENY